MAQKDIHPKYGKLTIKRTDGTIFETMSTLGGNKDAQLLMDSDFTQHPAWTGGHVDANQSDVNVMKFKEKFGDSDSYFD